MIGPSKLLTQNFFPLVSSSLVTTKMCIYQNLIFESPFWSSSNIIRGSSWLKVMSVNGEERTLPSCKENKNKRANHFVVEGINFYTQHTWSVHQFVEYNKYSALG